MHLQYTGRISNPYKKIKLCLRKVYFWLRKWSICLPQNQTITTNISLSVTIPGCDTYAQPIVPGNGPDSKKKAQENRRKTLVVNILNNSS